MEKKKNPFSAIHAVACVYVGQGEEPRHQWPHEVAHLITDRTQEGQK